jgi:hypothetical protein
MARQLQHHNASTNILWHGLPLGCTAATLGSQTIKYARLVGARITANRIQGTGQNQPTASRVLAHQLLHIRRLSGTIHRWPHHVIQ